jgi:putative transposase
VFLDREFFSFSALPHYRSNKTVFKTACAKHQKYMCDHNGTDKEFRFVYRGTDLLPKIRTKVSMILAKKGGRGMSKGKHSEAEMIAALKQMEAGRKAEDVAREVGVSKHTIYAWKAKYGGMEVSEAQEVKQLRDENARLKRLVADLSLDKDALQSVIRKNGWSSQS